MLDWAAEEYRALRLEEIDVRYAQYRLAVLEAEEAMARRREKGTSLIIINGVPSSRWAPPTATAGC